MSGLTPTRIGQYEVIERLAVGGMAEILLGRRVGPAGFQKAVVIKRLLPHLAHDQNFSAMLQDEARLAALLNHANIVQIYDFGETDDTLYIAMEHLVGEDLDAVAIEHRQKRGSPLPPGIVLRIGAWVAEALHYAHNMADANGEPLQIVHRDVNPRNIVVTHDGRVKLVDFGIAKATGRVAKSEAGDLKGKVMYMAPEQLRGDAIDHRSDIYGLGVTLFEALTGEHPVDADSVRLLATGEVPQRRKLRELSPDLEVRLESIISRALATHPQERYQSAREVQEELEDYLRGGQNPGHGELRELMEDLFGAGYFTAQHKRAMAGPHGHAETPSGGSETSPADAPAAVAAPTPPPNSLTSAAAAPSHDALDGGSTGEVTEEGLGHDGLPDDVLTEEGLTADDSWSPRPPVARYVVAVAVAALIGLAWFWLQRAPAEPPDALTGEPPPAATAAATAPAPLEPESPAVDDAPELLDRVPPRAKRRREDRNRAPKLDYATVLRERNGLRAAYHKKGLWPGDWPAIDEQLTRIDRLIEAKDHASAAALITRSSDRIASFRLSRRLLQSKSDRVRKLAGQRAMAEARVDSLVENNELDRANRALNKILARHQK